MTQESEPIPSKQAMRVAMKRLYDNADTRNGLLVHEPNRAADAVRAALLVVPADEEFYEDGQRIMPEDKR